jgi:hypothetical protein
MPTCAGDSQGASPRGDVMRCLKLFVAREVFMTSSPNPACHSQDLPSRREACRFSPDPRFRAPVSTVSQATAPLVSAGALLLAFASTLTTNGVSVIGWRLRQQLDLRDGGRSVLRLGISRGRAPSTCAFRRSAPLEHANYSFPLFLFSSIPFVFLRGRVATPTLTVSTLTRASNALSRPVRSGRNSDFFTEESSNARGRIGVDGSAGFVRWRRPDPADMVR